MRPMTSDEPQTVEIESKDLVPEDLRKPAAAAKAPDLPERNPDGSPKFSDPLAATVRAATSPFPQEAFPEADRPLAPWKMEEPARVRQPPASPPPPAPYKFETEPPIEIPETRPNRLLWLAVIGLGAGALSFLAVPLIRNAISPAPAPETPQPVATNSPAPTAPVPSAAGTADEPIAPSTSAGSEAPSAAPIASAAEAPATPPVAKAPATAEASAHQAPPPPPASGDEPDEAALATLEKGTGFLLVVSPLQTNVYLYGILAGQTNQRLVSKCGPRFIRLGTAPGAWQTQGSVSVVKCGGFTRVQMNP
jgi:hypothetical protein